MDDESDYFKVDSQWLSEKDRAALKQKEDELREVKYGSRLSRGVNVTLDITGRSVTEEDGREIGRSRLLSPLLPLLFPLLNLYISPSLLFQIYTMKTIYRR